MAPRARLTSAALACACLVTLAACGTSAGPREDEYVDGAGLYVAVQPQLVAPGDTAAAAADAGYFMTAVVEGVGEGQLVELQTWTEDGWRDDQIGETGEDGSVTFRSATSAWTRLVTDVDGTVRAAHVYPAEGPPSTWTDDFDDDVLDPLWVSADQPDLDYTCSDGDPRATEVSQGLLRLRVAASAEVDCSLIGEPGRINGHLALSLPIGFGTLAARIRLPESRDLAGSLWLQSAGAARPWVMDTWADGAVIAETGGTDQSPRINTAAAYLTDIGAWYRQTRKVTVPDADIITDGKFHVFSIDRTADSYVFRIDGEVVRTAKKGILSQPLTLALALLSPDSKTPSAAALSETMDVDWVRYWASPTAAG